MQYQLAPLPNTDDDMDDDDQTIVTVLTNEELDDEFEEMMDQEMYRARVATISREQYRLRHLNNKQNKDWYYYLFVMKRPKITAALNEINSNTINTNNSRRNASQSRRSRRSQRRSKGLLTRLVQATLHSTSHSEY